MTFEYQGTNFLLTILSVLVLDKLQEQVPVTRGQLVPDTAWVFETQAGGSARAEAAAGLLDTDRTKAGQPLPVRSGADYTTPRWYHILKSCRPASA